MRSPILWARARARHHRPDRRDRAPPRRRKLGRRGRLRGAREPGEELCNALQTDLAYAVANTRERPDVNDVDPLRWGSCATTVKKRFDLHLPGVDRHAKSTITGRLELWPTLTRDLERTRAAARAAGGVRIADLSELGDGAFLITDVGPREPVAGDGTPAHTNYADGQPALPVRAYWRRDGALYSVSGTRDGASLAEQERITRRLAQLINRRPTERDDR